MAPATGENVFDNLVSMLGLPAIITGGVVLGILLLVITIALPCFYAASRKGVVNREQWMKIMISIQDMGTPIMTTCTDKNKTLTK